VFHTLATFSWRVSFRASSLVARSLTAMISSVSAVEKRASPQKCSERAPLPQLLEELFGMRLGDMGVRGCGCGRCKAPSLTSQPRVTLWG